MSQRTRFVQWMQQALDQMNVQVHRAVSDLTGDTGMAIIRAIVAGERDPAQLATLRDGRCKHSEAAFVEHLTGHWRDEHLYTLASALQLYEAMQAQIAATTARLQAEVRAVQPDDRRDTAVPPHPNPAKEKAIRRRGDQDTRTALYRLAGVDLTRIDGISTGAARSS